MPISVTCQCGAKLEIDEKFLGEQIPCPDCQRSLPTSVPATPPPLELPYYRRTSGLAVLSLTLALVGAFTIVGTLAAIVVGVFAIKEIASKSGKLDGINFARAGIIIGAVFTFITLTAMISPTIFGLDAFLRELALAGRLQYPAGNKIESPPGNNDNIEFTRQSKLWASYLSPGNLTNNIQSDDLIMINVVEDAYIAYQNVSLELNEAAAEDLQRKALERFHKSELVNLLGRSKGSPVNTEGTIVEQKAGDDKKQEIILDIRLGGIDRRFLIQFWSKDNANTSLAILVGGARKSRFERMEPEIRKTFESHKFK
jgi:hypothetical protein